jgi:hypothetical protein
MITNIFLPVLFAISFSIQQKKEERSTIQLLTQKEWTLVSYGYDYNHNDAIDIPEECINDCNKDDTYGFCADGTGLYSDNILSCSTGITELSFKWENTKNGIAINFPTGTAIVHAITNEQLVLKITGEQNQTGRQILLARPKL